MIPMTKVMPWRDINLEKWSDIGAVLTQYRWVGKTPLTVTRTSLSHDLGEIDLIFQLFVNDATLDLPPYMYTTQVVRMKSRNKCIN